MAIIQPVPTPNYAQIIREALGTYYQIKGQQRKTSAEEERERIKKLRAIAYGGQQPQ